MVCLSRDLNRPFLRKNSKQKSKNLSWSETETLSKISDYLHQTLLIADLFAFALPPVSTHGSAQLTNIKALVLALALDLDPHLQNLPCIPTWQNPNEKLMFEKKTQYII